LQGKLFDGITSMIKISAMGIEVFHGIDSAANNSAFASSTTAPSPPWGEGLGEGENRP
jgi:hypothetical protein